MPARYTSTCSLGTCYAPAVKDGRCSSHQRPAKKARPGFGRRWTAIRARMLRRSDWTCAGCGHRDVTGASLQIDHITRHADGGSDELGNLQVLCTDCHRQKSAAERRR